DLRKSNPCHHAAKKAMRFAHGLQRVETGTGKQAEITCVHGKVFVDELAHESVKQPRRQPLEASFPKSRFPLAVNYIVAFAIPLDHLVDNRQRILQVGIKQYDSVAPSVVQARGAGDLVAEIS